MTVNKILEENPELIKLHNEGKLPLIRVRSTKQEINGRTFLPKSALAGWADVRKDINKKTPIEELENWNQALGGVVGFGYVVIDIDGCKKFYPEVPNNYNGDDEDLLRKKEINKKIYRDSRKIIADLIFKLFPKGLHVKTASGGFHCWLKSNDVYKKDHDISNLLLYPDTFEIEQLRRKPMTGCIEVFTRKGSKQCILPGSFIIDDDKDIHGEYTILPSGVSNFEEIEEYSDINKKIEYGLIKEFFHYNEAALSKNKEIKKIATNYKENLPHNIPEQNINELAKHLCEYLFAVNDSKHYFTLAFGNYLYNNGVNGESVEELGKLVTEMVPDGFFNNNQSFIDTLLKSYKGSRDDVKEKTGGLTCCRLLANSFEPMQFYSATMPLMNCLSIYPIGKHEITFERIDINYSQNSVISRNCKKQTIKRKNKETGEIEISSYIDEKSAKIIFTATPNEIEIVKNYADLAAAPEYSFSFNVKGKNVPNQIICGTNMEDIVKKAKKVAGIISEYGNKASEVLNHILLKFDDLGMLKISDKSSVSGIFLNQQKDGLIRFDKAGELMNIEKVDPTEALVFLKKIQETYPTDESRFSTISRFGLILPFAKVLRDIGNIKPAYYMLAGKGGTLKSSLAEMVMNFYNDTTDVGEYTNIHGGGSFDTPFRVGEKFGQSGYGFCVNECGAIFLDDDNGKNIREILKRAIESNIARKTNDKDYPSYQSCIFCYNGDLPNDYAIERRFEVLYFENSDRFIESRDLDGIAKLLNNKGQNKNFKKLRPIGDFVVNLLNEDIDALSSFNNNDELIDYIINELEKACDKNKMPDLDWLRLVDESCDKEIKQQEELDVDKFETAKHFLKIFINLYNDEMKFFNIIPEKYGEGENKTTLSFQKRMAKAIIESGKSDIFIPYKEDYCFIPNKAPKQEFVKIAGYPFKLQECVKQLQELAKAKGLKDVDKKIEQKRITINGERLYGIIIEYEILCNFNNASYMLENAGMLKK